MSGDRVRSAAIHGQTDWLKRLFEAGANPCETDEVGLSPLHLAVLNGHTESVECCAINDRGNDPEGNRAWALQQQTSQGLTALHVAVAEGRNPIEVVKLLLGLGADPLLVDSLGRTPADVARAKFEATGSAVHELLIRLLRTPPEPSVVQRNREAAKEKHFSQAVRRGVQSSVGDFEVIKEARAPIVPAELRIAEHYHMKYASENFKVTILPFRKRPPTTITTITL